MRRDTAPDQPLAVIDRRPNAYLAGTRIALILTTYAALATSAIAAARAGGAWILLAALAITGCAFVLSGFLNAAHDCVHLSQFGRRTVNRIAGSLWCTPIMIIFTIYQRQHLVHHRYTGVTGDTESHTTYANIADYFRNQTGATYWAAAIRRIRLTLRGQFPPSVSSRRWRSVARVETAAIVIWLGSCLALTWLWPFEMLIGYWLALLCYPAFAMLFSLPEHYSLASDNVGWPKARNVRSNALVRFFQWNANYHAYHHRHPAVPAVRLGAAPGRADFAKDPCERAYLTFHRDVIVSLKHQTPFCQ